MSDEQARRVGLNEALFREVNEQIRGLNREFDAEDGTISIVCECGDAECTERIELPLSAYERARSDSLLYIIATGHEFPHVESVVERADGYDVVRKQASEAAEVAEETDLRS